MQRLGTAGVARIGFVHVERTTSAVQTSVAAIRRLRLPPMLARFERRVAELPLLPAGPECGNAQRLAARGRDDSVQGDIVERIGVLGTRLKFNLQHLVHNAALRRAGFSASAGRCNHDGEDR